MRNETGGCGFAQTPRTPLVAGNWKMNLTYGEAVQLAQLVVDRLPKAWKSEVDVLMCPPATALRGVSNVIAFDKSWAQVGGQNCCREEGPGAFTGEVAASQLADLDCTWCIVGHSERRGLFGETSADVAAKCTALAHAHVSPIVCVGEPVEVYESGDAVAFVAQQVRDSLTGCDLAGVELAVAYEPVWAIGSGLIPTPEHVQEVAAAIRAAVAEVRCDKRAASTRVLYGGSVKPGNAAAWMACPDVDGLLVGGDALKADSFVDIVKRAINA